MKISRILAISLCAALLAAASCNKAETDNATEAPKTDGQNVTVAPSATDSVSTAEFWAEDLKPAGYNENIGAALALMMDANKQDQAREYDVLVELPLKASLESVNEVCDTSSWKVWDAAKAGSTLAGIANCYIAKLTAEDITKLTEADFDGESAFCAYIGSGVFDNSYEYLSAEWIAATCEGTGDMFVFDANGNVVETPDIIIEKNN